MSDFERERIQKPTIKALLTGSKQKTKEEEPGPQKPFFTFSHPTFNTIGVAATILALGFALGYSVGLVTNPSDSELFQINKSLKRDNIKLLNENNSLNLEKKHLADQLDSMENELKNKNKVITEKDVIIANLQGGKEASNEINSGSLIKNSTLGEIKEIKEGETAYFCNGEVYVSLVNTYLKDNVIATVGSLSYKNVKMENAVNGSKIIYKGKRTYEVRLIKIDFDSATFQVLTIN